MSGPPRHRHERGPDWILIGALAGLTLLTGAAAFGMMSMIWTDKAPPKKVVALTPLILLEGPVFSAPPLPEQRITTPAPLAPPAQPTPVRPSGSLQGSTQSSSSPQPDVRTKPPPAPEQRKDLAVANAPTSWKPPAQQVPVEQWRVVATANANAFNLGGHINKAGVVDSLASSHLRDALKAHRNFGRLPPHLRTHIESQNIDLRRLAPYRVLVGIDDNRLEAEQGVRFERVVASR